MSFKLFFLSTFGGIKSTPKIETEQEKLRKDFDECVAVEQSEELKSYLELEQFLQSEAFLQTKKEVQDLIFKGSQEEKKWKEYQLLHNNRKIKKYYLAAGSADLKRYNELKKSEILIRYNELKDFVEGGRFREEKLKYKSEVFKGSPEQKKRKEFQHLEKNKSLKNYLSVKENKELAALEKFEQSETFKQFINLQKKESAGQLSEDDKHILKKIKADPSLVKNENFKKSTAYRDYLEVVKGNLPKQYEELKAAISSDDFKKREAYLSDKTKFQKSESFSKFQEYQKLKKSENIRFFIKYPKSSEYKNYLAVDRSIEKTRYEELKTIVESDAFIARKAYLEDDKKWSKTDEYQKEQLFLEMKKRPHLVKYFKLNESSSFDFLRNWNMVFEDRFEEHNLNREKWQTVSPWASDTVGRNFSLPGDLQGFTDGDNIKSGNGKLQIVVNRDKNKSLVWRLPIGFTEEELDYTSGLLSTGNLFQVQYGILEAKIKFAPEKELVDVFYLGSENYPVRINLMESGAIKQVGITGNKDGREQKHIYSLTGLTANKYYIFRLEWEKNKLSWKINNREIFTTTADVPDVPMHINLASIVVEPTQKMPHNFTLDWIRFYQKKS